MEGEQPQSELAMLAGSGLAGKSKCLVEQCSNPEMALRPPMRQVQAEVMSWREALPRPDSSRHSPGVSQGTVQAPGASTLATNMRTRSGGHASSSLGASSFAPTPDETVNALITELLVSCNVPIDAEACCFYHGALMSLRRYCRELERGNCWNRTPADIQNVQCSHCGVLTQLQTPPSCGSTSRCFFCNGPLSNGSESQTASVLSL